MSKISKPSANPSQVMGAVLSWLRQQAGLDQRSLAQALGITQASWSRIENGNAIANIEQIITSCDVISIDFVYLAKLYLHICDLLKEKSIDISLKNTNSPNTNDLEIKKIIKETIARHALTVSNE